MVYVLLKSVLKLRLSYKQNQKKTNQPLALLNICAIITITSSHRLHCNPPPRESYSWMERI